MELRRVEATNLLLGGYELGSWLDYSLNTKAPFGRYTNGDTAVAVLKFTVPAFTGVLKNINVKLTTTASDDTSSNPYYAICTSDSNKVDYRYSKGEFISDNNQIASGTLSFPNIPNSSKAYYFDIKAELQPNITYYLFLWGGGTNATYLATAPNHSITIEYITGFAYIDTGSELEPYQCYVDNGESWEMCIPYIDNGTSWEMYS